MSDHIRRTTRKLLFAALVVLHSEALPAARADEPKSLSCEGSLPRWRAQRPLPVVEVAGVEGVMLPEAAAPLALCPCSRRRPIGPVVGYWSPSEAAIAKLERALPDAIKAHGEFPDFLGASRRQYLGIIRQDHRAIYVNVFPKNLETAWRSTVVRRCVWDKRFLGVEYDVDRGTFTQIAFQGQA